MKPVPMSKTFLEKVWGTPDLAPWYESGGRKIGEVWFGTEGEPLPLLMKLIFTSERLSVQVHPNDEYAAKHEHSRGKTEMWHVLRAEPGAALACGLTKQITPEHLRAASLSGEIESLLNWVPVKPGDTVYVPAGTIHAIGAGVVVCEVQQQSDVTYRLYDYGRPRELHLDKAMDVSSLDPHPGIRPPVELAPGELRLAECEYFAVDALIVGAAKLYTPDPSRWQALIVLEGTGQLDRNEVKAGDGFYLPPGTDPFELESTDGMRLLRAFVP
ncbi:type I phosphomannose isomerase catalytic subunit [Paludibaculum fermentans]|uniref:Class I mannose-6-phosphate isomerase n=1 Tax=Paludibaculum fermentans TaxID=1473598 RepID=A0A7S7NWR1_PALFE|nr:type I phosphomannose isomerase catalytic subunit [Paludibaculum fermentans]QOY91170.1 class I mannose-6-phosphate isomerase [Paludibaculum fermentans]